MLRSPVHVTGAPEGPLRGALDALRTRLDVPGAFPPDALAEADRAARDPVLPVHDATDIPLFTIDPPGSLDLDQALHLSRQGTGYRVRYAIADVAAFVVPDGPLDREARRRVNTFYFPDGRIPLHPPVLSEGAASLLPGQTRPAVLWTIDLDADGRTTAVDVRRALVRSRARLDYAGVQQEIDAGTAEEPVALLQTVGRLREGQEAERGGVSLRVPEQEIVAHDHTYELTYRAPLPADGWNAQISLLTGMAAADLMLAHGTGVLRTLPPTPVGAVDRLRRTAFALHIDWPHHVSYAQLVRSLDPREPRHAAFLQACATVMGHADYTVFRDHRIPELTTHAAVAAPYTHCTAPLRRLVDRYTGEIAIAACAGKEPPEWVDAALDAVRARMAEGGRLANKVDRACIDLVEAAVLQGRVGEVFQGCVVELEDHRGTVQVESPAVIGEIRGAGPGTLGERLPVRLTEADPQAAKVSFVPA
ncbi:MULTISPECIES: RNB domain-containing ribonuclease [unclassified Streptomyces]|uniref:RNB domain-containing ribonuclease n=1 Tax=unclassified Streptomyces TaxID=2593676 RepID=UPI003701850E